MRSIRQKTVKLIAHTILLLFAAVLSILTAVPSYAAREGELPEEQVEIIEEQAGSGEVEKIGEEVKKYSGEGLQEIIEGYDPEKILTDVVQGKFELSFKGVLNRILMYLFKEIYLNISLMIKLIILIILCAILKNLQTSFLSESVGELAFYACYVVIVSIMVVSLSTALRLGTSIIDSMVSFMYASIPALITLLVSGGNITSGGLLQPFLIMIVEISASIFKNVFLPLVFLSAILSIVNNISEKVNLSKLAALMKQIAKWGMGLILTSFVAFVSLQGTMGAVVDGVTAKTAKFAIGAFIPVVGGYLSDAAETVVACTLLIKNAAGVVAMMGVIGICLLPMLKIFALISLYRITCVLTEPISDKRISGCLNDIAGSLTYIFGIIAAVVFMFLISITVIVTAGNFSAMVR